MFSFLARLLPAALVVQEARKLRAAGELERALAIAEIGLEKLRRNAAREEIGQGCALKGSLLLELGREDAAVEPLLEGRAALADEPQALGFLAGRLLDRRNMAAEALDVFVAYLRAAGRCDERRAFEAKSAALEKLATPAGEPERARRWNEAFASARPDLSWPHRNLGLLDVRQRNFTRAAAALRRAAERDRSPRTSAMLAYAVAMAGDGAGARALVSDEETADRGVMLMRAHTLRVCGEAAEAARWFRRADCLAPLDAESLLAYAEVLVNAGEQTSARDVLARIARRDARHALLSAGAAAAPSDAATLLAQLLTHHALGADALRHLLALAAHHPAEPGLLDALDQVPASARNDVYWIVRSDVLLAGGDAGAAAEALGRVKRSGPVAARKTALIRSSLVQMCCEERYTAVLRRVAGGLPRGVRKGALTGVVSHAFMHAARVAIESGEEARIEAAISLARSALERLPELDASGEVQAAFGLLLAAGQQFAEAIPVLEGVCGAGLDDAELRLQLARATLLDGDGDGAGEILQSLDVRDSRVARVVAAQHAISERWEEALETLPEPAPAFRPALAFLAGRDGAVEESDEELPGLAYFAAVKSARAGELEDASRLCARVPAAGDVGDGVRKLDAWLRMQAVLALRGDAFAAQLADALAALGAEDLPPGTYARLLPLFAAASRSGEVRAGLSDVAGDDRAGLCHRTAVRAWCEAEEHASRGDWDSALEAFEEAFSNLCVALADREYLEAWSGRRLAIFGVELDADQDAFRANVVESVQRLLRRWDARLDPETDADTRQQLAALELAFRAELRATEILQDFGGFTAPDGETVVAGPAYVSAMGWEEELAAWLEERESEDVHQSVAAMLRRLLDEDDEELPEPDQRLVTVRHLYSTLRLAVVLQEDGHLEEALASVRETRPDDMDEDSPRFRRLNPAFASEGGGERLAGEYAKLETTLLLKLGEQQVASAEGSLDKAIGLWSEALEASSDSRAETEKRIRELAIGRSRVLDDADREPEAIRLLEAVNGLCGDEELRGALSLVHTHYAVRHANETDDWDTAIGQLRIARRLNEHSTFVDRNFVVALGNRATEFFQQSDRRACGLLAEALTVTQKNLHADPHNIEWQQLLQQIRKALVAARLQQGIASPDDLLDAMFYAGDASAARLSAVYHNRGVEKARRGELDGAIDDLTKALDLEPTSDVTRQMLTGVMLEGLRRAGIGSRR